MSKRIYILDPGHGGINPQTGQYVTSGKRSPIWSDGSVYYEGVGNREIAKLVGESLKALGISYDFTVRPEVWTDVALHTRTLAADNHIAKSGKPGLLISIHSNGAAVESAHGFEVFTSPGQTASDKFADIAFLAMKQEFPELTQRPDTSDGDYDKEEKLTVLTASKCPAILIESMFHTNQKECKMLMSSEGKKRVARAIVTAIQKMELV